MQNYILVHRNPSNPFKCFKTTNPSIRIRDRKLTLERQRRYNFCPRLRCQKFEGGGRGDIDVRIRHNYAKTGGGRDRARSKRRGRAGQIVGFMDRWRGDRGRGGEEERRGRCLDPPRCVLSVEISAAASEKGGQASEEPATDVNRAPPSPCPFLASPFLPLLRLPFLEMRTAKKNFAAR